MFNFGILEIIGYSFAHTYCYLKMADGSRLQVYRNRFPYWVIWAPIIGRDGLEVSR